MASPYAGRRQISYLLFADDSLSFCQAKVEDCNNVMEILTLYEVSSGQKINRDKTTIFFFFNRNLRRTSGQRSKAFGELKV